MSGYGEVVRETAAQAHERKVEAIELVIKTWPVIMIPPTTERRLAEACLAAAESGF